MLFFLEYNITLYSQVGMLFAHKITFFFSSFTLVLIGIKNAVRCASAILQSVLFCLEKSKENESGDCEMADDYGYFGKGTEGYIHYMQAQDEISGKKRGGGGKRGGGCLQAMLAALCLPILLCVLFVIFVL
jgi:hypothetical protein